MDIEQINILLNDRGQKAVKAHVQDKYVRHNSTDLIGKISTIDMRAPYDQYQPVNAFVQLELLAGGYLTVNVADIELLEE